MLKNRRKKENRRIRALVILLLMVPGFAAVIPGQTGEVSVVGASPSSIQQNIPDGTVRDWRGATAFVVPNPDVPRFSTNDYIRIRIYAYRLIQLGPKKLGMPDGEKTNVTIRRSILIEGKPFNTTFLRNITFEDDLAHEYNLERLPVGAYMYHIDYFYADGIHESENIDTEVRHPALRYYIKKQDHEGRHLKFIPKDKGMFTVTIRYIYNQGGEEVEEFELNTSKNFHITDPEIIAVKITVQDEYGWVNDLEDGKDFIVVYKPSEYWELVQLAMVIGVLVLLILAAIMQWRSFPALRKKKEGFGDA